MLVGPEGDFTPAELDARATSRMPANYARSNYPSSGNSGNLLPEYSLLRITDLD